MTLREAAESLRIRFCLDLVCRRSWLYSVGADEAGGRIVLHVRDYEEAEAILRPERLFVEGKYEGHPVLLTKSRPTRLP